MRYGSSAGIDSQLWGLVWTQTAALSAPGSYSECLKRDAEGSFESIDTGDAADWNMVSETSIGTELFVMAAVVPLIIIAIRKRKR
jgi:hypothetical protein